MNSEQKAYNMRQLLLMSDEIVRYESNNSDLQRLTSSLGGLLESMIDCEIIWRNAFLKHWGMLEDVLAVTLDEGRTTVSDLDKKLVEQAVLSIKELIDRA